MVQGLGSLLRLPPDVRAEEEMESSAWFTRGWTLQELLAPLKVVFYNQHWEKLGTKHTLSTLLTSRTGIDDAILSNKEPPSNRSIAQRMSWASQRATTRVEDIAYCLLGIFDVAMPLLYGERGKAFFRLQEEILKKSNDHSLFAWPIHRDNQPGLLADSPAAFAGCQQVVTRFSDWPRAVAVGMPNRKYAEKPYSMTNRGLSIRMTAVQVRPDTYLVRLKCDNEALPAGGRFAHIECFGDRCLGMYMKRLFDDDQYARVTYNEETFVRLRQGVWDRPDTEHEIPVRFTQPIDVIEMQIPQELSNESTIDDRYYWLAFCGFEINSQGLSHSELDGRRFEVFANLWWPEERLIFVQPGEFGIVRFLDTSEAEEIKLIKLGFDFDGNLLCSIQITEDVQGEELGSSENRPVQKETEWHKTLITSFEHPTQPERGLWNLKGDRHLGLEVELGHIASLKIHRAFAGNHWTWAVHIKQHRRTNPC